MVMELGAAQSSGLAGSWHFISLWLGVMTDRGLRDTNSYVRGLEQIHNLKF